jgi:hypothetical protein
MIRLTLYIQMRRVQGQNHKKIEGDMYEERKI